MGLFDIFKCKRQNKECANSEWAIYAQKMRATAIEYAQNFDKKLDFSENSIADIAVSKPTENQIWSMSIIFGSYLGETLLKNGLIEKGFAWGKEASSNIPLLIKDDGCYITPNDKVYKRLVNGSVDSVISFYQKKKKKWR